MDGLPFKPISLHNDAPVDPERGEVDLLNLTPLAKEVAAIAVGTPGPFTMAVTARWGYGKTSMLGLVRDLIRQYGKAKGPEWTATHTTVWFNAWQYEREEEPLVPLLLAIQETLAENVEAHQNVYEKTAPQVWETIKKLPGALFDVAAGFKFKGKVGTALWLQLLTGIKGEIEAEVEPGKIIEALRERFSTAEAAGLPETTFMRAMAEFRAISKGLTDATKEVPVADRPKIVVFVDDLDRCHPDAALKLLDGIKLVLNEPGFVFLLALDKTILEEFLVRRYELEYGASNPGEVGRRYVDKIIQLEIPLPPQMGRFAGSDDRMRSEPSFEGKGYLERLAWQMLPEGFALPVADVIQPCRFLSPRDVTRLFLRLRLDIGLYERSGKNLENLSPVEVAQTATIMRLVEMAFGGAHRNDFLNLIVDSSVGERLWESIQTGAKVKYNDPDDDPEGDSPERTLSESVFDVISSTRGLLSAVIDYGERWLMNVELRRRLLEFLDPDADAEFGDLGQFNLVQGAIRRAMNLRKGESMPSDLSKLDILTLPSALNDEGLRFVARCAGLTTLVLAKTEITTIEPLRVLTQLRELDLSGTKVHDIKPLRGMTQLKTLNRIETEISDGSMRDLKKYARNLSMGL